MIDQTILYLPQTDCLHAKIKPYSKKLGISVNWNPDLRLGSPLAKLFNRVVRFEVGEAYLEYGVIHTNKKIIELVKEHSPKYVIWPTMNYEILESTFHEMRSLGSFVIGWFFDDECRFNDYSRWWIPYMDYIFTCDKASVPRYRKLGAKAFHLLVTAEPDFFKPIPSPVSHDVSFIGSKSVADRDSLVEELQAAGIRLAAFGKGWPRGYVTDDDVVRIYNESRINICFTKSYHQGERRQLKNKIFDITMCGGFLLCEYADGLEDYFKIGSEIACFHDLPQAIDKIKYYLGHDDERRAIARAGMQRAVANHSQHRLLEQIFHAVETDAFHGGRHLAAADRKTRMPKKIKKLPAAYHRAWAEVLKTEGFDGWRWQEELELACRYDPSICRRPRSFPAAKRNAGRSAEDRHSAPWPREKSNSYGARMWNKMKRKLSARSTAEPQAYDFDQATDIFRLRDHTLDFISKMRLVKHDRFAGYRYSASTRKPVLYNTIAALLIRHLYGVRSDRDAEEIDYMLGFQDDRGIFFDPVIACPEAESEDWWGWRHLTLLALMVSALYDRPVRKELQWVKGNSIDQFRNSINSMDWGARAAWTSSSVQNHGIMLQYARDYQNSKQAGLLLEALFTCIDAHQDPRTGLYGDSFQTPQQLSLGVQAGFHLWQLYFYDRREIRYRNEITDSVLKTQNILGGYGVRWNSSACEDIDSLDPLVRLSRVSAYRRRDIHRSLRLGLAAVLHHMNGDGGWGFRSHQAFQYGFSGEMFSGPGQSNVFFTWFRTLALAYCLAGLDPEDVPAGFNYKWTWQRAPGMQFL